MEINLLTQRLFAEGYTRSNHPKYVWLGDYANFTYTMEKLKTLVWEAPCGLLSNETYHTDTWYDGFNYIPENDKVIIGCPIYHSKDCPHRFKFMAEGENCVFSLSDQSYDYENSVEKLWDYRQKARNEQYFKRTKGEHCFCCENYDEITLKLKVNYDVQLCINYKCANDFCSVRRKQRDLTKVNIYYDIKRTWKTKSGLISQTKVEVTKGIKVFDSPCALTDAEIWLKIFEVDKRRLHNKNKTLLFRPKISLDDHSQLFFSKMHRTYTDYEEFEFSYEPFNFRIEKRAFKDIAQDLADISEGIKVVHFSDTQKAAAAQKKQRRETAKGKKMQKLINKIATIGWDNLEDFDKRKAEKWFDGDDIEDYNDMFLNKPLEAVALDDEDMQMNLF